MLRRVFPFPQATGRRTHVGVRVCSEERSICVSVPPHVLPLQDKSSGMSLLLSRGYPQPASRVSSLNYGRVLELPAIPRQSTGMTCLGRELGSAPL
jgi:hypothetical protein